MDARVCPNTGLAKKAILIVKKTYAFHGKTRIRQGYVVTSDFFDPIGKSKVLEERKGKMFRVSGFWNFRQEEAVWPIALRRIL